MILFFQSIHGNKILLLSKFQSKRGNNTAIISETIENNRNNINNRKICIVLLLFTILFIQSINGTKIQVLSKFQTKLGNNTAIISKTIENNRKNIEQQKNMHFLLFSDFIFLVDKWYQNTSLVQISAQTRKMQGYYKQLLSNGFIWGVRTKVHFKNSPISSLLCVLETMRKP